MLGNISNFALPPCVELCGLERLSNKIAKHLKSPDACQPADRLQNGKYAMFKHIKVSEPMVHGGWYQVHIKTIILGGWSGKCTSSLLGPLCSAHNCKRSVAWISPICYVWKCFLYPTSWGCREWWTGLWGPGSPAWKIQTLRRIARRNDSKSL